MLNGAVWEAKQEVENERQTVPPSRHATSSNKLFSSDELVQDLCSFLEELEMCGCDELNEFEKRAIPYFSKQDQQEGKFTLQQGELFQEFCEIFESKITDFVARNNSTVAELYSLVKNGMSKENAAEELAASGQVVQMICAATDFCMFADYMQSLRGLLEARGVSI